MRHSLLILAISLTVTAAPLARAQIGRTQTSRAQSTRAQQSASTQQTRGTTGNAAAQSQLDQMEGVGQIAGDERFLRDNRELGQMVGGTSVGVGNLTSQATSNTQNMGRGGAAQGGAFGAQGTFGGQNTFGGRNTFGGQNPFGAQGRTGQFGQFGASSATPAGTT